jgi:hypothetical protein
MLALVSAWLGLEEDERRSLEDRRDTVRFASAIAQSRGTRPGLELGLRTAFPSLPLRRDRFVAVDDELARLAERRLRGRVGRVGHGPAVLDPQRQAAVARVIERLKPVNARYRLRVKTPPRPKPPPESP